ncbi:MAG TPA: hypothetical protein PLI43_19300 [Albidovulum sp.]|uniref:hypothetical protein n=1 Tax=Albidovulum sp. TaxID=1872424 RepID=UPI002CB4A46C|nr:hypothetical protein [Albidovulum sp.]
MARFHGSSKGSATAPLPFVLAHQALKAHAALRADRIEATMRRYEMPSVVDIAKRPGFVDELTHLFDH